jgi:hypothetical protein
MSIRVSLHLYQPRVSFLALPHFYPPLFSSPVLVFALPHGHDILIPVFYYDTEVYAHEANLIIAATSTYFMLFRSRTNLNQH